MSNKCLDDELFDIYIEDAKTVIESLREIYEKGRADVIGEIATNIEVELLKVMPRDKVMFLMYKIHTVLEQLKEQQ